MLMVYHKHNDTISMELTAHYPHAFAIAPVRQSPYMYLLNHWTKCVSRSHGVRNEVDLVPLAWEDGMGRGTSQLFLPPPWEGPKGLSIHTSFCPSCYLLLNHWTKSNQILYTSCSDGRGVQRQFFCPKGIK